MGMLDTLDLFTFSAQVIVRAFGTPVAVAWLNFSLTSIASWGKGRSLRIVQMIEDHHATVLGSSEGIKLVVIPLTERKEILQ